MTKTVDLKIANQSDRPVEIGSYTVPVDEEMLVCGVRDDHRAKALKALKGVTVERVEVYDDEPEPVEIGEAEKTLDAAAGELEKARARERELLDQANGVKTRLQKAEAEELEAKKQAALQGDSVSVASQMSGAPEIREEAEELAFSLWAAQVQTAKAEVEHHQKQRPVLAAREREKQAALDEAKAELQAAEEKVSQARREHEETYFDNSGSRGKVKRAEGRVRELEAKGPRPIL